MLTLAERLIIGMLGYGRAPAEFDDQARGDTWLYNALTRMDATDCVKQFSRRHIFQQIAPRARLHAVEDILVVVKSGEQNHSGFRQRVCDLRSRRDAVHLGHLYIHQDDIRLEGQSAFEGLLPIFGLADHDKALVQLEDGAQPLAHESLILGDQHANSAHRSLSSCMLWIGTCAST